MRIDLNADVGESFGSWPCGEDGALVESVSSVSIACGFHAGDPGVMRRTLRLARRAGVAVGAHPGLPDLQGFGRREMRLDPGEVEDLVLYQIAALVGLASAEGLRLQHVKPHGALYHMAAADPALADAIARATVFADRSLRLMAPVGSALAAAAERAGLTPLFEAFVDRAYRDDGTLVPRDWPGAVISEPGEAVSRAIDLARSGTVTTIDGTTLEVRADTLCIHGDTPGAGQLARRVRDGLERAGVQVVAPSRG